ncbi:hypothetical protein HK096_005812 [Nowakowskiella sp. JEL0078]|nr:hypothetical protein HK096_005812 [Nowakowskiella sp. JEL0078]
MGAKIGNKVQIDDLTKSSFREFDLIEIGNDCAFDYARIRPFAMDGGNMILEKIFIGDRCIVNVATVIAPGSRVPSDICFPPLSSSHEIKDARPIYQDFCRTIIPGPNIALKLLIGYPLIGIVNIFSMLPWLVSLYLLSSQNPGNFAFASTGFGDVVIYFSQIFRITFKCLALIARDVISPFFFMFMTIVVKRLILGLAKPGTPVTQWDLLRKWVMGKLLGDGTLGGLNKLLGKHYEYTSMIYRALGAKIGNRIYWPGTGLFIDEHEYLTVGDDVVFGSRSHIFTTDVSGPADVVIGNGAMIADRCVLLPGVHVGRHTMLGTGSLGKRGGNYPAGSVWLGSKKGEAVLWDEGNTESAKESTISPFGISFYGKQANYTVIPMWACALYCIFISIFDVIFEFIPLLGAIQIGGYFFKLQDSNISDIAIVFLMIISYICFSFIKSILIFVITITAKWIIHGQRKAGKYNWDESSYCQRWQILIAIQSMNGELLESIRGSWYIVKYFRLLGAKIGKSVCLYPTGADPMMTEPDLVTIGDNVMIDNASVICHINSKGQFSLNPLIIRDGASLRAQSRLLSGAEMDEDAVLMEHTLILSGDVAAKGVWQGWPLGNQSEETEKFESDTEETVIHNKTENPSLTTLTSEIPNSSNALSNLENGLRTVKTLYSINITNHSERQHLTVPQTRLQEADVPIQRARTLPARLVSSLDSITEVKLRVSLSDEDYMILRRRTRGNWFDIDDRLARMHFTHQSNI